MQGEIFSVSRSSGPHRHQIVADVISLRVLNERVEDIQASEFLIIPISAAFVSIIERSHGISGRPGRICLRVFHKRDGVMSISTEIDINIPERVVHVSFERPHWAVKAGTSHPEGYGPIVPESVLDNVFIVTGIIGRPEKHFLAAPCLTITRPGYAAIP